MAVYKTGTGLMGTRTLGRVCGDSGTWGHQVWDMWDRAVGHQIQGRRGRRDMTDRCKNQR